ncbi:ribonuclease P [Candidatus Micrarchaeota archaeon]|nr:MAG: ribonuclease P [Candidatus Micrarchaeota archaeon]
MQKSSVKSIALERIELLLAMARKELDHDVERARRYVKLARRLGTRYRVRASRASKGLKISYCKRCNTPWVPGRNLEVRLEPRSRCVVYKCSCGYERRFRYKR